MRSGSVARIRASGRGRLVPSMSSHGLAARLWKQPSCPVYWTVGQCLRTATCLILRSAWRPSFVPSISGLAVDHFLERLAIQKASQVFREQARDEPIALRMGTADMRKHDDPLRRPERVLCGQRLLPKHVQHRAGDLLCLDRSNQVVVLDEMAAAEIQ